MNSATKSPKQRWLRRLQLRLQMGVFLKQLVDWLVVFLLVAGVAILCIKLFWPHLWPNGAWLFAGAAPLFAAAWYYSSLRRFGDRQSVALLDRSINAGGLLMSLSETPDEQWESRLPAAESVWQKAIPAWRPWRAVKHLLIPVAFVAISCILTPRTIQSLVVQQSTISENEIAKLNDMLKELDENDVLQEEEREELLREIEKLASETRYQPLTHENWETVDALKQKMDLELASRENLLSQAASALAALERAMEQGENSDQQKQSLQEILDKLGIDGKTPGQSENQNDANGNQSGKGEGSNMKLPDDLKDLQTSLGDLADFIDREIKKIKQCEGCPNCGKPGGT